MVRYGMPPQCAAHTVNNADDHTQEPEPSKFCPNRDPLDPTMPHIEVHSKQKQISASAAPMMKFHAHIRHRVKIYSKIDTGIMSSSDVCRVSLLLR
jgi:hypothetical protein